MRTPSDAAAGRARRWSLAVVLWAFGLATTTLLVGMWGRTVTTDATTLERSTRAVLDAEVVSDRVNDWLSDAIATASEWSGPEVEQALLRVAVSPEADNALSRVVEDIVGAALAPSATETSVDVAAALGPLVPVFAAELEAFGVDVRPDELAAVMDRASTVVLETEAASSIASTVGNARSLLTTVLVGGIAALVLFGSLAVALAEDHVAMVRSLAIRLAVSAFTFAVFLRIGAWAMDPARGRSPLARGGAVVLGSNHLVLFLVAAAALAVASTAGMSLRTRRRRPSVVEHPPREGDDTSEEPVLVTA